LLDAGANGCDNGTGSVTTVLETWTFIMILVKPGEVSPRVVVIQILLNRAGSALVVDGHFGPKTRAAVVDFQGNNGIAPPNAVVGPDTWWKLPLGKNTEVVDVVDVGDPGVGGGAVTELTKAKGDPIELGLMCGGIEQMVNDVIGKAGGSGTMALLRITGHGNLGRWMTVSVGSVAHLPAKDYKEVAEEDHSYIALANFDKLAPTLARLKPYFAPYGMMEHGGCSLGKRPETRTLMHRLADLWGVPVSVGIGLQRSILNFDGATFTAYPNMGTLKSWSSQFRSASY
jgi:hypothetical protein